jgi:protein SCO1/2
MFEWKKLSVLLVLFSALDSHAQPPAATNSTDAYTAGQPRVFQAQGVVKELESDGKTVVIQHHSIPGYMMAMTMPFVDKNPSELAGLRPGDSITFRVNVTKTDGWIDHVAKTGVVQVIQGGSADPVIQVVRDVPPLDVGDELPEYHLTNELGQAVSTTQFHGQALAFTFFFTRCPYPNFCPYVSNGFEEAQKKLAAMTNGPANWHLLSISFDPQYDTPAALKAYASLRDCDPARWDFVTGDLTDLTAFGSQFGEYFGHDPAGGFNHNLRTVIVDAKGRIQRIIQGNTWTSDELVAEILKAAAAK